MEISANGSVVTIDGNIKTIGDYNSIRSTIQGIVDGGSKSISLNIVNSISLTSSIIGYLLKLAKKDGIRISTKVGDSRLHELLSELNLIEVFNVTKR